MPARCPAAVLSHPSLAASLSFQSGQGCFPTALPPARRPQNATSQVTMAQIHHGDLRLVLGSLPQLHQSFSRREVPNAHRLSLVYQCPVHQNLKKGDAWLSVLEGSDCTPGSPALSHTWYRPSDRYPRAKFLRNSRRGEHNGDGHMDPPGYPTAELVLSKVPEGTQDLWQPHKITLPAAPCCTKQHKRSCSHSPALSAWDASSPRCSGGCPARLPKYLPSVATQGIPKPIYIDPLLRVRWHGFKTANSEVCLPRRLISVLVPGPCPDSAGQRTAEDQGHVRAGNRAPG